MSLFDEACDIAPADRPGFLDRRCTDPLVRAKVDDLLEHDKTPLGVVADIDQGKGMEILASKLVDSDDNTSTHLPKKIGRYTVVRKIGEGGMGVVYEATQERPSRSVALKVLRQLIATPAILRRFEFEAEVLGRLRHPGISQIYEAGSAVIAGSEQPYFAMEYVQGRLLLEFADHHQLDMRRRLELFAKICDAAHFAHQIGVIHRDLKPGNILVDESEGSKGQPKILDFGVARATDGDMKLVTMQTNVGQLVGTLPYMSPEQVSGDSTLLDSRSDVYSLGVILYEILSNKLPHAVRRRSIPDAVRMIQDEEPTLISADRPEFRGDLETIVCKALEKEKGHRYQSAFELASDVRRFLSNEPIVARPLTTMYQLRKFARRNRTLVTAFALVLISLIGATAVSTRLYLQTREARAKAENEAAKATAINAFLIDDLLSSVDPNKDGTRQITMREAIDRAAGSIGDRFADQPLVEAEIRNTLSDVYRFLGDLEEGRRQAIVALKLLREQPNRRDANLFVETLMNVAIAHTYLHDLVPAEPLFLEAAESATRTLGADSMASLMSQGNLAWYYEKAARFEESQEINYRVLEDRLRLLGPEHSETLSAMNNVADVNLTLGHLDEAEAMQRNVLAIRKRTLSEDHPETLGAMENLGQTLVRQYKLKEAEELLADAEQRYQRVFGAVHLKTFWARNNLGLVYMRAERYEESEVFYRELIRDINNTSVGDLPWNLTPSAHLANSLQGLGRLQEALTLSQENLDRARQVFKPGRWTIGVFTLSLGKTFAGMNRFAEAEKLMLETVSLWEKSLGRHNPRVLEALQDLIDLYDAWQKPTDASKWRIRLNENSDSTHDIG